jgi:3-oxoacyl-(acyl-carrier-protein) synthase
VQSLHDLWHQEMTCVDNIVVAPSSRWVSLPKLDNFPIDYVGYAGPLNGAQLFDNKAFAVPATEATHMDPMQRLVLEKSYEALYHSSLTEGVKEELGVFFGADKCDWAAVRPPNAGKYGMTGANNAIACARLSFVMGLQGPNANLDCACASALTGTHVAKRALQNAECDAALAIGVNLNLNPGTQFAFLYAGLGSPTGRSYTHDARADGMGRGEACGAIMLHEEGVVDQIVPSATGSSLRQDGRGASLTAPNGPGQQKVLTAVTRDAAMLPSDYHYCEVHGTGTPLGDAIEAGAIRAAILNAQPGSQTATISLGGLKAQTGHTEGASGTPGLLKTITVLRTALTPPEALLRKLNPHVQGALQGCGHCLLPLSVGSSTVALDAHLAGPTNSFGFSGTIASLVLDMCQGAQLSVQAPKSRPRGSMYRRPSFQWIVAPRRSMVSSNAASVEASISAGGNVASSEVQPVDADVPFMQGGLTSLDVMRLAPRLRAEAAGSVDVPLTVFFDQPTARLMTSYFESAGTYLGQSDAAGLTAHIVSMVKEITASRVVSKPFKPVQVAECLVCVSPGLEGANLCPLIAAPMVHGTGSTFTTLARVVESPVYYLDHPVLATGAYSITGDVIDHYARAIKDECIRVTYDTFYLIGTSFGASMAHWIACATSSLSFAPRGVILVDPPPPFADLVPVGWETIKQDYTAGFLNHWLGGARLASGGEEDTTGSLLKALQEETNTWPEEERSIRIAESLAKEGLRGSSAQEFKAVCREVHAYGESQRALRHSLVHGQATPKPPWETFLVLCSGRVNFFSSNMSGERVFSEAAAGYEAVRAFFGNTRCEVVMQGGHLEVCERCISGQDSAFMAALRDFLSPLPARVLNEVPAEAIIGIGAGSSFESPEEPRLSSTSSSSYYEAEAPNTDA